MFFFVSVEIPKVLQVFGRELTLPRTCGGLLDTTFNDMCVKVSKFSKLIFNSLQTFIYLMN